MQYVNVRTEGEYLSTEQIVTGDTREINGEIIKYVISDRFENIHDICNKTLQRYRKKINTEEPSDVARYYTKIYNVYLYSDKILKYRKYKVSTIPEDGRYKLNYEQYNLDGVQSEIFKLIKSFDWNYACGSRYKKLVEVDECVNKMENLYDGLISRFTGATVTMFYTTEHDPEEKSLHNHFVISIKNINEVDMRKKIGSLIRKHTGTKIPYIDNFNTKEPHYPQYIIKHIPRYLDGWGILSNSKAEIDRLTPRTATIRNVA